MTLNVAYHSSDMFSSVVGTSIISLFVNNKSFDNINIYIIEKNMSERNKIYLNEIAKKYSGNLFFIPMQDISEKENLGLVCLNKKWSYDGYNRLFLDSILPEDVKKVLYLDSDVLVCGDLLELWNTELDGCPAAACMDCLSENYYSLIGLSKTSAYCNSGVILFDLEQWKRNNYSKKIKEYLKTQNGYVFFMEQSVFNVVLQNNIKILPAGYNVSTLLQVLDYDEIYLLRKPNKFYSQDEISQAVQTPKIIHMTRSFLVKNRPWIKNNNHPIKSVFEKYRNMTPWAGEELFDDKRNIKSKICDFFVGVLPKKPLLSVISYIYNNVRIKNKKKNAT